MKYVINIAKDTEDILVERLKNHLFKEVRFASIFPNFGNVRISVTHPFVYLIESTVSQTAEPVGLFPSITVVLENDNKDTDLNVATLKEEVTIDSAETADMLNNSSSYILSEDDLHALQEMTKNNGTAFALGAIQRRKGNFVVEVWSKNPRIKNRLYDIVLNYLVMGGRFELHDNYDIIIEETTISGQKSGNYNYDFGYTLYGAFIRFNASYIIAQYVVDTDLETIADIDHYVSGVVNEEA